MDPFNITIRRNGQPLGLNIHPQENIGYMVLFEGSLVGEIFLDKNGDAWGAISAKDLLDGGYPGYPCDESADCAGLMFNKKLITRIGKEISKAVNLIN